MNKKDMKEEPILPRPRYQYTERQQPAREFAYQLREVAEIFYKMNNTYREMRYANLFVDETPFKETIPQLLRDLATATDTIADGVAEKLQLQAREDDEYRDESASILIRSEAEKLRLSAKYLPQLNNLLRFADEEAARKEIEREKKEERKRIERFLAEDAEIKKQERRQKKAATAKQQNTTQAVKKSRQPIATKKATAKKTATKKTRK